MNDLSGNPAVIAVSFSAILVGFADLAKGRHG